MHYYPILCFYLLRLQAEYGLVCRASLNYVAKPCEISLFPEVGLKYVIYRLSFIRLLSDYSIEMIELIISFVSL